MIAENVLVDENCFEESDGGMRFQNFVVFRNPFMLVSFRVEFPVSWQILKKEGKMFQMNTLYYILIKFGFASSLLKGF